MKVIGRNLGIYKKGNRFILLSYKMQDVDVIISMREGKVIIPGGVLSCHAT